MADKNYFQILNAINVNDKTEKKNGLTYLSWSWAWAELKKLYPKSFYTIYENADGLNYHHDGKTAWVKTGVTVVDEDSIEHIEYLPVMDFRNKSIPVDTLTSFDVNKTIQRSLTKAVARHGIGLYLYSGEDLPEDASLPSDPGEREKVVKEIQQVIESPLDAKYVKSLEAEIVRTGTDKKKFLNAYKVKSVSELSFPQYLAAMEILAPRPDKKG